MLLIRIVFFFLIPKSLIIKFTLSLLTYWAGPDEPSISFSFFFFFWLQAISFIYNYKKYFIIQMTTSIFLLKKKKSIYFDKWWTSLLKKLTIKMNTPSVANFKTILSFKKTLRPFRKKKCWSLNIWRIFLSCTNLCILY